MKRLFTLAAAAVLFGTGIIGCSNTAEGAKEDASKDTKAVTDTAGAAVDKTVQGTEKAAAATEKGVATAANVAGNAAAAAVDNTKNAAEKTAAAAEKGVADAATATKNAAEKTTAAAEQGVANAANATEKGAAAVAAATEHTAAKAGEVATHTGKVLTVTPTVKAALLNDKTLYPTADASKINVDTDSDGVTVHLKGTVPSNEAKKKATEVATASLAGKSTKYKISNELTVAAH